MGLAFEFTVCDKPGMDKPQPSKLSEAVGISQSYASMILSDEPEKRRTPPRSLAIFIFRKTGWRHESIAALSEEDMATFERHEPWQSARAA